MRLLQGFILWLFSVLLLSCAAPVGDFRPIPAEAPGHTVYVVQRDWHTGIAVRRQEIPSDLWPERADFPTAEYLEAGWGDADYYQSPNPGLGLALKAALWPTRSVLNVEAIPDGVPARYPCSRIIELRLPPEGFRRLVRFIHDSFDRRGQARTAPLPSSLPGHNHYYPARGSFHLFNTCNTWILRGMRQAGLPLDGGLSMTAAGLRWRLEPHGRLIGPQAGCP